MHNDLYHTIEQIQRDLRRLERERKWHAAAIIGALICIVLLALAGAANARA